MTRRSGEQVISRPAHPQVLEPTRVHRTTVVRRLVASSAGWPTMVVVVAAFATSLVLLTAVSVVVGLAITHVGAHSRFGYADEHVSRWFAAHRTPRLSSASLDLTKLADVPGVVVVAAAATVVLLVRRWGRFASLLVIGLVLELGVFELSEHVVRRARPHVPHLGVTPPTFSWPSGHTAATVVLYGGIAIAVMVATTNPIARSVAWAAAILLTAGVAWARVYEGEHHLSDVIGGVLLGIGCLVATVLILRAWGVSSHRRDHSERLQDEPQATPRVATGFERVPS